MKFQNGQHKKYNFILSFLFDNYNLDIEKALKGRRENLPDHDVIIRRIIPGGVRTMIVKIKR